MLPSGLALHVKGMLFLSNPNFLLSNPPSHLDSIENFSEIFINSHVYVVCTLLCSCVVVVIPSSVCWNGSDPQCDKVDSMHINLTLFLR